MKTKIYIDGSEGTTGLRIFERMAGRDDIELLTIDPALRKDANERRKLINASDITFLCLPDAAAKEAVSLIDNDSTRIFDRLANREDIQLLTIDPALRKDPAERAKLINASDITFLCLPDAAAREAVSLIDNDHTRVIDASTAHRTAPGWAYGFPELSIAHREAVASGKRIANPGCHATGFISIAYPLVAAGVVASNEQLTCFSLTGYSGGGKKMIAQYEDDGRDAALDSPRPYGLTQQHKHLPEMQKIAGLQKPPVFTPIVADYYAGMLVGVPLTADQLQGVKTLAGLHECLSDAYAGQKLVRVLPLSAQADVGGFLAACARSGWDGLEIIVTGNDERMIVFARFDNLGKGASGAAIQSMNLMIGCDEAKGLNI